MKKPNITPKQYKFLCYLSRNPIGSIYHLGKKYFTTEVSIYKAIDNLNSHSLILTEQIGKNMIITLTKKGSKFILDNFEKYNPRYIPKGL